MTKRYLIIGLAILALGAVGFIGRDFRRARNNLVTLRVRNAPLREVISTIERQTREQLALDKTLDAKISLEVKNAPLADVLNSICEQAGARWAKEFGVYQTDGALKKLAAAFETGSELGQAGWTNIAPRSNSSRPGMRRYSGRPGAGMAGGGGGPVATVSSNGPLSSGQAEKFGKDTEGRGFKTTQNSDVEASTTRGGPGQPPPGGPKMVQVFVGPPSQGVGGFGPGMEGGHSGQGMVRGGPNGVTTMTTEEDGNVRVTRMAADGTVIDQWSSERLLAERLLTGRIHEPWPEDPTIENTRQLAAQLKAQWAMIYHLEKSPYPSGPGFKKVMRHGPPEMKPGEDFAAHIEQDRQRERADRLRGLPESRVQRARQMQNIPN